jgi:hypothetical protein
LFEIFEKATARTLEADRFFLVTARDCARALATVPRAAAICSIVPGKLYSSIIHLGEALEASGGY